MTSRAEGIQIEERSMTLEICIAINNEEGGPVSRNRDTRQTTRFARAITWRAFHRRMDSVQNWEVRIESRTVSPSHRSTIFSLCF